MALILDTRFLVAHAFPPSDEDRARIVEFMRKIAKEDLLLPSVVVAEFIKVAGPRMGLESAKARIRGWVRAGAKILEVSWEDAELAGEYLLKVPGVPMADAIIAAQARRASAVIVSDDPHFRALDVRTIWYKR